jgi:hypothetical protein
VLQGAIARNADEHRSFTHLAVAHKVTVVLGVRAIS